MVKFKSTRGEKDLSLATVILRGYANDGGLTLPETIPKISCERLHKWKSEKISYIDLCKDLLPELLNGIPIPILHQIIDDAFEGKFPPQVIPHKKVENLDIYELYHGPTLAFKDLALSMIGSILYFLYSTQQGEGANNITVIVATSGDTGSAAIEAIKNRKGMRIFVIYPEKGRISNLQRLQMTTSGAENVYCIGIDGDSDTADVLLKSQFVDPLFVKAHGICTINSINWARIAIQVAHQFYCWVHSSAEGQKFAVAIPSGGFGNATSALIAREMGCPIEKIICGVNDNDTFARFIHTGLMKPSNNTHVTIAPSLDIQIPYNTERMMDILTNGDHPMIRQKFEELNLKGEFTIDENLLRKFQDIFLTEAVHEDEIKQVVKRIYPHYPLDTHTAVAIAAVSKLKSQTGSADLSSYTIAVQATAHPAKFKESIEAITGLSVEIPPVLKDIEKKTEKFILFSKGEDWPAKLKELIENH